MLVPIVACGSSNSSPAAATPVATPTPAPHKQLIQQGSYAGLDPRFIVEFPFSTTASGTLAVHVNWTHDEDQIAVYVTKGACSLDQLNQRQCDFVATSETAKPKPIDISVPNVSSADYVLWVGTLGPHSESISYQLFLTAGAASAEARSRVEPQLTGLFRLAR